MNYPTAKQARYRAARLQAACFIALPLLASVTFAQDAAPATPAADQEVVKMSPFTVSTSQDYGYRASNSIAGTRSNTPIKDIALNIQVFTKDLTDDLVIADQTNLERYNAAVVNGGADVQSDNVIQQAYNAFLFRGFVQNWGLRDGIREYDPVDAQGLARVEVVKGPAAALYGLSYAGGVMNSITKQVNMDSDFGSTRLTYSNEGEYRATLDANYAGKAGTGKFGVRFNGAYTASEDKREHSQGKNHFTQTNALWEPFRDTSFALLVEESWRQKPNDLGYYTRSGGIVASKASQELGVGVVIPLQIDHPEIPWTWNWADAGANDRSLETHLYRGTVTQKIGDDFFITGYIQANRHQNIDSNGWDDGGNSQNAAGWDVTDWSSTYPATGWINPDSATEKIRKLYHWRDWSNTVHAYGANAVYKLETGSIKNTFTVGGANWEERFWSNKQIEPNVGTNPTFTFFDLPVQAGIDTTVPMGGAPVTYVNWPQGGNREHNENSYYYANWQFSALDNRLKLNAAVNHTHIKNTQWPDYITAAYSARQDVSKNSPMFGAMFDITKEVSIFAVHSTSLFPTTDKNTFFVQMPPEVGKSNEIGFKVDLLDSKVTGTVSYYKITKSGGGVNDPAADNRTTALWDADTVAQRMAYWGINATQAANGSTFRATLTGDLVPAELESKGFEADLAFQPIKPLQIVFSYANNDEKSTKGSTLGQANSGHIKQQYSVLTKYSFINGDAKGLSLGVGLQGAGKAYQGYQTGSNGVQVSQYNPATFYAEFFAGYQFKAFGLTNIIQFNAKNLTKVDDVIGWKPSGQAGVVATERYKVPTYARFSITYGLDF